MNKNTKVHAVQTTPSRLTARIAAWPKFAQQYVPMSKQRSKDLLEQAGYRDLASGLIIDNYPDAPKNISASVSKRLLKFSNLHTHFNAQPAYRDEIREQARLEAAALSFIQAGYMPRWLLSDQFEKGGKPVVVCAKAALMRRLRIPLERAVPEVFTMMYARVPSANALHAALEAQVADHAGR